MRNRFRNFIIGIVHFCGTGFRPEGQLCPAASEQKTVFPGPWLGASEKRQFCPAALEQKTVFPGPWLGASEKRQFCPAASEQKTVFPGHRLGASEKRQLCPAASEQKTVFPGHRLSASEKRKLRSAAAVRPGRMAAALSMILLTSLLLPFGSLFSVNAQAQEEEKTQETVTLRVCNWEEYIDEGGWDEDETIDLPSGRIRGENSMVEDFEEWYYETYGIPVKVAYSNFGTNEDLYNLLTLGDVYDLVCPSEYLIMKLMEEGELVPLSDSFFDVKKEENYYSRGVSPFIRNMFETKGIGGEFWAQYAAGYMWGVTGLVYNPAIVSKEKASSWKVLADPAFRRRVTIKDSVRESYFAAVGALESEMLTSDEFRNAPDYQQRLEAVMNDTSPEMIARVEKWLKEVKDNVFSFETDAGKADMITGKVAINYQWSGDAVYTMDQADEDGLELAFSVPEESTDIYFDGWVMLKKGIGDDQRKQHAAEAFINFLSRPDNAIRNMYSIGYTSVLSGGEDPRLFEYACYNYEAEDDEEETVDYDLNYFFAEETSSGQEEAVSGPEKAPSGPEELPSGLEETSSGEKKDSSPAAEDEAEDEDQGYLISVPASQADRQIYAAYPPADVIARSCIMTRFNEKQSSAINRMWVNVRCFDIRRVPVWAWLLIAAAVFIPAWYFLKKKMKTAP